MFDSRLPHKSARGSLSGESTGSTSRIRWVRSPRPAPSKRGSCPRGETGKRSGLRNRASGIVGSTPTVDTHVTVTEWHTYQAENLGPSGRVGSTPTGDTSIDQTQRPDDVIGKRGRLKPGD